MERILMKARGSENEFWDTLCECIKDGLRNVLGEGSLQAVLFYFKPTELSDPIEFDNRLCSIFKGGAINLEKVIVKDLYRRLNILYRESESFNFAEHVNSVLMRMKRGGLE